LINILFVCTGNICRSPLAEGILREKLKESNIPAGVDSCGFESFHVGDQPDARARSVAQANGIDISGHRGRLFNQADFDHFDYIYAMDSSHYSNLMRLCRNGADRAKVDYVLNMVHPGQNCDVQDPWYHDMRAFEKVFQQLDEACSRIAAHIVAEQRK